MKLAKVILSALLGLSAVSTFGNWQPFVGINASLLQGTATDTVNDPYFFPDSFPADTGFVITSSTTPYHFNGSMTQVAPGFTVGVANRYSNNFYLGFDANVLYDGSTYTATNINETDNLGGVNNYFINKVNSTLKWQYTFETQLGYFATPNFMPYVKLGITTARDSTNYEYYFNGLSNGLNYQNYLVFNSNGHTLLWGPKVAIGGQYSINQHVRAFFEVDYTHLSGSMTPTPIMATLQGTQSLGIASPVTPFKENLRFNSWAATAGLNYYF
jgi:hypothetical protein